MLILIITDVFIASFFCSVKGQHKTIGFITENRLSKFDFVFIVNMVSKIF